jgi:hypothetical protein
MSFWVYSVPGERVSNHERRGKGWRGTVTVRARGLAGDGLREGCGGEESCEGEELHGDELQS